MAPNWLFLALGLGMVTAVSAMIVQPEWRIYYNLTTRKEFDIIDSNNPRFQYYKSKTTAKVLRIGFGPIPCSCQHLTCGCCTGMNIRYFNFDRTACMNFTYDPYEFSLSVDMLMNDDSLYAQSISGKNPPAACLPVLIPYGPPVDFCIRFFNIHTPGYNIFMCMDFETRIVRAPVLILHFDCLQMGADGIHHHKPEDALTGPEVEEEETQSPGDIEVYDEVFEEESKNSTKGGEKKPEIKETAGKQDNKGSERTPENAETENKPKKTGSQVKLENKGSERKPENVETGRIPEGIGCAINSEKEETERKPTKTKNGGLPDKTESEINLENKENENKTLNQDQKKSEKTGSETNLKDKESEGQTVNQRDERKPENTENEKQTQNQVQRKPEKTGSEKKQENRKIERQSDNKESEEKQESKGTATKSEKIRSEM